MQYAVISAESDCLDALVTLNTCRDSCNPPTPKKMEQIQQGPLSVCYSLSVSHSHTVADTSVLSVCCRDSACLLCRLLKAFQAFRHVSKEAAMLSQKQVKPNGKMFLPRSKPIKRTKDNSSSFVPFFDQISIAAIVQPCTSRAGGTSVAWLLGMNVSRPCRCYVSGWCGTPWCVTVAIINLGFLPGVRAAEPARKPTFSGCSWF